MLEFSIKIKLRESKDTLNFPLPSFNLMTCLSSNIEDPAEGFYFNNTERKMLIDVKNKMPLTELTTDMDKQEAQALIQAFDLKNANKIR
mgnify:FL=1